LEVVILFQEVLMGQNLVAWLYLVDQNLVV
jgi:hypothetical protein